MGSQYKKGGMEVLLGARCGICGFLHRFDPYTSRIKADKEIIDDYRWEYTEKHGLVCDNCAHHDAELRGKLTFIDYPAYPKVPNNEKEQRSTT